MVRRLVLSHLAVICLSVVTWHSFTSVPDPVLGTRCRQGGLDLLFTKGESSLVGERDIQSSDTVEG